MAISLSQTDKFLQLTTPLGENILYLLEFSGIEEISNPFHLTLHMLSAKTDISADQIIGKPVSIQINTKQNTQTRYFHGIVTSMQAEQINEGMRYYTAHAKPWLSLLAYSTDCRIFQNKSVIEIIEIIFHEQGFTDYQKNLSKTYPKKDYCVQYQESLLNFMQRLLAEEGIFYYFEHEKNKHLLILSDKNIAFKNCMPDETVNHLSHWNRHYSLYSGNHTQTDYNFKTPDEKLTTQQQTKPLLAAAEKFSLFNYPGDYEAIESGKHLTQQQFEAEEARHDIAEGTGHYINFSAGKKFTLSNAPSAADEGDYILTLVTHYAKDSSYLGINASSSAKPEIYHNAFNCIPYKIKYVPMRKTLKPLIHGIQTAVVVGPAGEELYTDHYGRVRVQFHWDRKGKKDDASSCWVRVMQSWAGKNWGALFIPRIGQEVAVQFLDGNPDKPFIIGSVYNATHLPPYQLPIEQTQSGIRTSSSNELFFEDRTGQEKIAIQAQKDFEQKIKNNLAIDIDNLGTIEAKNSFSIKVSGNSILINTKGIFINGKKININQQSF